jgi:ribosomal protein S18 acetylase RimI-like enzyme
MERRDGKTMDDILEDLTISALLRAMEANVHELWTRFGCLLGAELHDESDLLWFASGLPFELANGIARSSLPTENLERTLDETLKRLTIQHVPMAWLTGPSTRPRDLGKRLQENGWVFGDEAPGMAVELRTLDERLSLPSELTIARVSDDESLRTWIRVMTMGSELPEFLLTILLEVADKHSFKIDPAVHFYLGMLGGKAVATSLLYLGGGVAGIYNVSTLPELRKQGIGTALTVAPLLDARAWGYQIGTLQSTQMGLHLYRRLGFQEYCTFNAYFWSGEALETE